MTTYISCACNRIPHSADWGRNGLICYAACNAVAIYDPHAGKLGKVLETLHRHTDRINVTRWIKSRHVVPETELLSGSVDGSVIVWSKRAGSFECSSVLHVDEIVTICTSLYLSDRSQDDPELFNELLVCTGAADGNLKLWLRSEKGESTCVQTLTFGRKLPIESCLSFLPNSDVPLLAVALEDSSIQLFVQQSEFVKAQVLVEHEDWVRCMDFSYESSGAILLATGSQDAMIRLWRIAVDTTESSQNELQQKKQLFSANSVVYNVTLESVLSGHEGWVYGIHWHPVEETDGKYHQPMKLLSCSLDKSMVIWEPDNVTGIWTETVRVGEVGGNSLGFYGCKFSPDGSNIFAHGYQGSFHIWNYCSTANTWIPRSAPTGHFGEVVDLCWEPRGRFLMTASADQTTRVHAALMDGLKEMWHEIGRPQVHGYDMSCLAILTPYMFASGAEEKVVRIFTAPTVFKAQLAKLTSVEDFEGVTAESATVPALGLTNKANFASEIAKDDRINANDENYLPPNEEQLMQDTLWPELQKLYGHGYEIFCMAARHDGTLLATACRSSSPEHSAIIIWSTSTWSQVQKLMSHQLTVTQMAFSPNDKYLVSVSRDRRWSLFEWNDESYVLLMTSTKKDSLHSRIIWCCAWSHDCCYFATGSRDGKIGIWNPKQANTPETSLDVKGHSVTALAFASLNITKDSYVLAVGYEAGNIEIHKISRVDGNFAWKRYRTYDTSQAHHSTVKRLAFRPQNACPSAVLQFASGGSDNTVKIYDINISDLSDL